MPTEATATILNTSSQNGISPFFTAMIFGTAIGTVLGFSVAFGIWAYPPFSTDDSYRDWIGAIATLIGAVVTLLAAIIAFMAVMYQTHKNIEEHLRLRKKRYLSDLSTLPIINSTTLEISKISLNFLIDYCENTATNCVITNFYIPEPIIQKYKDIIEYSEDNEILIIIKKIILSIQILSARINNLPAVKRPTSRIEARGYCCDMIDLIVQIEKLFNLARGADFSLRSDHRNQTMISTLNRYSSSSLSLDRLEATINSRYDPNQA